MSAAPAVRPWRGLEAFAALASDWERLAREAGLDPLCNAHRWTLAYARAFVPDGEAFGWSFEQGGETVGIVALRREPSRGPLALRRALFLADGTFDSDYLAPPVRPGHERVIARELFTTARAVPGLEAFVLAGMPDDSPFLAAVRSELAGRDLPRRERAVACLSASLPGEFEPYLAALKPRMRTKVRGALRSAREEGARLEWCTREEELEPWLSELYRLHELRWRAEGRPGSFDDPRRRAFYLSLARDALVRGALRFARLELGGATLAVQLGVLAGSRYYQVQEGYDPAHESDRVGVALRALAIESLIAEGVRTYDFMAGDSRHKRDWGGELRSCTTVAFPLPRWRAKAAYSIRAWFDRRAGTPR